MKNAAIRVDRDYQIGRVDDRLYGSFIEHLGRAVYGGIYEPGHPSADELGFRTDVLELVRELKVPVVRYPGGNFVSGYRWEDGIGPREQRPRRLDLAWNSIETNQVGVDDFAQWAKRAGAEVMMAVNLGTRGPEEARQLVEYCNHPGGTALSDLRVKNGFPEPHNIRLWCLGNEMDGPWQMGHKTMEEYARIACEAARLMKWVDPSIQLVACGSSGAGMETFPRWEDVVLTETYDLVDYVSIHTYFGNPEGNLGSFLARPCQMEDYIRNTIAVCDYVRAKRRGRKQIHISFDEWNVWYHSSAQDREVPPWQVAPPLLEDVYDLADALVVGGMAITLLRHADRVKVACLAQLVNVIAPIMTRTGGPAWRQTIFYPFAQVSRYGRGTAMDLRIDSPKYDAGDSGDAPILDAAGVWNEEENVLTVFALNRDQEEELGVTLRLDGFEGFVPERFLTLTGAPGDTNTEVCPDRVKPQPCSDWEQNGNRVTARLPKLSWNVLQFRKKA